MRYALWLAIVGCAPADTAAPVVIAPTAPTAAPLVVTPAPLAPSTARATIAPVERDPARAEALFREAREAMARGDTVRACRLFAERHALDPADGTLANLAMCEEAIGDLVAARAHWEEVLERSLRAGRQDRAALARQHIDAINQKIPP